jgi:DHA1 family bicyclomycin/chloramphenicol resistance-like MFS transporter
MCGAGMASSVQASLTTLIAVALGGFVGAQFNGTTLPLSLGFLVFGLSAFGIIFWAERGRLFTRPGLQALRRGNVTPLR